LFCYLFFVNTDVKQTLVKILLQQWDLPVKMNISSNGSTMGFTSEDEHLIKWLSLSKKIIAKQLHKMLFDRR